MRPTDYGVPKKGLVLDAIFTCPNNASLRSPGNWTSENSEREEQFRPEDTGRRRNRSRNEDNVFSALVFIAIYLAGNMVRVQSRVNKASLWPNPSIEGTLSGLRPPSAPHVKR